ncbi:NEDD4-binding protein 2-like 2 isoform X1 [Manis pentadactyla]|uniref:NEDD4-binding protein 2-like 2 isoform X1 n=1 Tax=Manis pentadactyla TaxID=143292 RepID=UPI00255C319A|nr:NEDD4-binding protein 2-like 2 isoform X1 [Manis pentadactyla]XP_036760906.2 NEDD4-binding protein 2-like 2 isoform X1 [Manis pentadactyla]XP_057345694.1 NEDD4-binding protein 2-like 2 isoform X1 [Manis pentadactyla]XP_057345706.1 NEDD4-binding protein 2-like 2 isoform X1 [Manis pentadactyla]
MPYDEIEARSLDRGEELAHEPCCKKLKSTEEAYVFPHHRGANFHRIQEKTGNDWVPVTTLGVRGQRYPQEDKTKTTDLLKPMHNEMPGNRPDAIKSIDSQVLQGARPPLVSTDDEIYSTSKAFIGPIYKPPEKKKCERRSQVKTANGIDGKGGQEKKQKLNSKKLELDNELSQFYKEIEELENEKDDLEGSCREPKPFEEQLTTYYQGHNNDPLRSEEENRDLSNVLQSHCHYQQYEGNELGKYSCNGQVLPTFYDDSFTSFRPEWQSVHSFIVPQGPPLPSFNYLLNTQRFNVPPTTSLNICHAQDGSLIRNGFFADSCHVNWNCLTFDQHNEYIVCGENTSSDHSLRNGYGVQGGYASNGFCETREGCWEDPSMYKHNVTDRSMNQQFQEENFNKLQKLLILLRGLPGSGKTTLSRILLGQSRDGIVFSTDDYFHHQDGYRYNVDQLGDAHDWNQSRAKQAINQGRSPVIIDNTNTQAWEMKPYVEMAIGKGYRVEFHEPETWWKFDPEELEKRNKHGVSRKKIAQMLDRYEYQMSISVVMNSVEPPHKSTQRSPPPQGTQRERAVKKTGHRLITTKQKRNRKRKKKQNSYSKTLEENPFATVSCTLPGDREPPQREEEGLDSARGESGCAFAGGPGNELGGLADGRKDGRRENTKAEDSFPHVLSAVELDKTPKNFLPKEDDDLFPNLSSMPNESSVTFPTVTQNLSCVARGDCSSLKVEKHVGKGYVMDIQGRLSDAPCSFRQGRETADRSLPNETVLCHQYGSRTPDKVLRKEQGVNTTKHNYWALCSNSLSAEASQLSPDKQSCFDSWPVGPHQFVCEQRPKKERWQRRASPDSKGPLIKLLSTSEGASGPRSGPETWTEEKLLIENEDVSPPSENTDSVRGTEINILGNCSLQLDIPKTASHSAKNRRRRQKRMFNLTPDLNLLGQSHISVKVRGKCGLLPESHRLKIVLEEEQDGISEINNEEESKQKLTIFNHYPSWFYFDIIQDSPLNVGGQFYSHFLPFNRQRHPVYFYKNPISPLMLQYTSRFWKVSFPSKDSFLTFRSQTRVDNKPNDVGFISSEILSTQPDTLYSFRIGSDLLFLNENSDEKQNTRDETKPLPFLQIEDNQALTGADSDSSEQPLSQGFASQLVKLFGSPGVPLESLLPGDCVVPLIWKTLKMIYLQWKTSVEKRQKKIG